jgi:hypothetical protein
MGDSQTESRLNNPKDWLRLEIYAAARTRTASHPIIRLWRSICPGWESHQRSADPAILSMKLYIKRCEPFALRFPGEAGWEQTKQLFKKESPVKR